MDPTNSSPSLELKFCPAGEGVNVRDGTVIEGYASVFGVVDRGGDVVARGAYAKSLERLRSDGRSVKLLWQHNPAEPIGVWDEIVEDEHGLRVKGRLLPEVARAREAAALLEARAIDGLSIGYRPVSATRDEKGRRVLTEIDLWEVSLVTFPMLPAAKVGAKTAAPPADGALRDVLRALARARRGLAEGLGRFDH
ncbi:MAG: HK97 family phage prohead protease [Alphaproteobacteria bacterium]|nr:MAG: HK97 family phage prohead protease [Alphaproteobacteria bacterium]